MSFLYPAMLAGLAAVSVPVIIHFLNKFRVRTTDWGAMRFLLDSVRKNEKRVKIEDLILLILRCLLVALAVFAFARPVLKALAVGGGDSDEPVAAIVLLDNSASMGQSAGAGTVFDQAKREVTTWLDKQPGQSLAALYLVSDRTEALIPKPGADMGLFRKMLSEAEISDRGSDLAQAVRLAVENLKTVTGRPREIRIYSDGQAKAWLKKDEIVKLAAENPDIRIVPILIGEKAQDNVGIVALRADGGIVAFRQPCRFHVEVANYGSSAVEGVRVTLSIDGGPPAGDVVIPRIEAGATQAAGIIISFPDAGPRSVTASIAPDAFAADNRRTAAVDVVSQMNVLLGEGNHEGPAIDRDGFFIANALVPLAPDQVSRHYLSTIPLSLSELPAELGNRNNAASQAVFLCNPGPVSQAVAQALKEYVQAGGNLVIFPGPLTHPEDWKSVPGFMEMLPAEIGPLTEELGASAALAWQGNNYSHPVTSLWTDSAQGSLAAVKFSRHFPLTVKRNARTIIQLSNGEPSVVEWGFGEGNVVLFNSTATPEWNNFPLHPAFVPFLQRLMGYMNRGNESRLTLAPGEPFRKPVPEIYKGRDFSVQRPGSEASRTAGQVVSDDRSSFIRYAATDKAGVYKVSVGQDPIAIFSVQMDPAESDLRKVDPAVVDELKNVKHAETQASAARMVVTRDYWTLLIWIAAAFFVMEAIMGHRASHAR